MRGLWNFTIHYNCFFRNTKSKSWINIRDEATIWVFNRSRVDSFGWNFVWNAVIAVNAVEKNSPRSEIHRISYKNSTHRLLWQVDVRNAVNPVKKVTAFLTKFHRKIHRISYKKSPPLFSNVYWIWFKFTRNIIEVSESWRSGIRRWRHKGGKRFEPV